jgi:thioredoxin domain-containing protein 5
VPEPAKQPATPVVKLDKSNFEEKTKTGVAFVKFYAPWCGHCKRLAPTWEQLAQTYEGVDGVMIGHVDCTAGDNINKELCNSNGVNGFPTLNIYKDGVKVEEYSGKRDLNQLKDFVEKHLSAKTVEKEAKDEL